MASFTGEFLRPPPARRRRREPEPPADPDEGRPPVPDADLDAAIEELREVTAPGAAGTRKHRQETADLYCVILGKLLRRHRLASAIPPGQIRELGRLSGRGTQQVRRDLFKMSMGSACPGG